MEVTEVPVEKTETDSKKNTEGTVTKDNSNKTSTTTKRKITDDSNEVVPILVEVNDDDDQSNSASKGGKDSNKKKKKNPSNPNQMVCINLHCTSGDGLTLAPVSALTYYGLRFRKDVEQKVCDACLSTAESHWSSLSEMLKNNEPLFRADFPPIKDDVVVMDTTVQHCDMPLLNKKVVRLVEEKFHDILHDITTKYNIKQQMSEACYALNARITNLENSMKEPKLAIMQLEDSYEAARKTVYDQFRPQFRQLQAIEIEDGTPDKLLPLSICPARPTKPRPLAKCALPPTVVISECATDVVAVAEYTSLLVPATGPIKRPPLTIGMPVYIARSSLLSVWLPGRVLAMDNFVGEITVTYDNFRPGMKKKVTANHVAYTKPNDLSYPMFSRVIAPFTTSQGRNYFSGTIAEPQKPHNKYRYLVFLDAGFVEYVKHEDIFPICMDTANVIDDLPPGKNREFIRGYIEKYPERAMVRLQVGQKIKVEYQNAWFSSKVTKVDGSLVTVKSSLSSREEVLYRGSLRLRPMYDKQLRLSRGCNRNVQRKSNEPLIEYRIDDDSQSPVAIAPAPPSGPRNVAKKSTVGTVRMADRLPVDKPVVPLRRQDMVEFASEGIIRRTDLGKRVISKPYVQHCCSQACIEWTNYKIFSSRHVQPLCMPLMVGFDRLLFRSKGRRFVVYTGPCGRKLRNMEELRRYFRITKCTLGLDLFNFDNWVRVVDEFYLAPSMFKTHIADISNNKENMAVSCVNEIQDAWPQVMVYSTKRLPQKNVNINTDPAFMAHCDCVDDCSDKEKCACWQLTFEGIRKEKDVVDMTDGYNYRRLFESVTTGIYECHSGCKCSKSNCLNRVVQYPLSQKLQIFRTLRKGWGIRTLSDIPKGAFVCTYVGRLHTEHSANEEGRAYGDEYLAELDYIEVAEGIKDGYENDVVNSDSEGKSEDENEDEEDEWRSETAQDEDFTPKPHQQVVASERVVSTRAQKVSDVTPITVDDDDDDVNRQTSQFTVDLPTGADLKKRKEKISLREMLGDAAEDIYVMDAKYEGNIGRYLNHSCEPNVFVQNVFVDTHDPRFPWIAFFASKFIRAGFELTWDYNYDVGSVPGKTLYCYCNTPSCRGRLL